MSTSSVDSLGELPQPFDISNAVFRALRLSSSGGTEVGSHRPASERLKSLTATEGERSKAPTPGVSSVSNTFYDSVLDDIHLAEMEIEGWAEMQSEDLLDTEIEQLDDFCRYIDNDSNDELDSKIENGDEDFKPASAERSHSYSNYPCKKTRQPPAKKRRCTYYEGSNADLSLVKYAPEPLLQQGCPWRVRLHNSSLWKQFDRIGTEMVITKNGRRMFPSLLVNISGLDPNTVYSLTLEILPVDNRRYKFIETEWVAVGRVEKKQHYREYRHPDSPKLGSYWMENPVAFKLVKLTNNKNTIHDDQIILNSMQQYQPYVRITSESCGTSQLYTFEETKFIAVTAYQNSQITQLKIDNNPYARAFRETVAAPDGCGAEKKGGHYTQRKRCSSKPRGSKLRRSESESSQSSDQPSSASSSPQRPNTPIVDAQNACASNCTSATSVESGFESDDCTSTCLFPRILPEDNPYNCPLNYWADDNSLYNPALINPPPLLDSISEPYLRQSSYMAIEFTASLVSPVKGLVSPVKALYGESVDTDHDTTFVIDVETIDNDDVFL